MWSIPLRRDYRARIREWKVGYLHRIPCSREKVSIVMAMYGNVKDVWVIEEDLLRSVAMVNILNQTINSFISRCRPTLKHSKDHSGYRLRMIQHSHGIPVRFLRDSFRILQSFISL